MPAANSLRDRESYWAVEEEPEDLISGIQTQVKWYRKFLSESRLAHRIVRNWRYVHGHYFATGDNGTTEIRQLGEQGEIAGLSVNHHRNLKEHLLTMVIQHRPAWQARAVNSDLESLEQARLGTQILDYYMHFKRAENFLRTAVEQALVCGNGFVYAPWDTSLGRSVEPVGFEDEEPVYEPHEEFGFDIANEGDLRFCNPSIFDVAWDPSVTDWSEVDWVNIRTSVSRWDLAARYPDLSDEILDYTDPKTDHESFDFRIGAFSESHNVDRVGLQEFYHKKKPSCPKGKYVCYLGDILLENYDLQYDDIPLYPVTPGDTMFTPWGYSPLYDHQGIQEAMNADFSAVVSNHKSGAINRFQTRPGNNVTAHDINEAFALIESEFEIKTLELSGDCTEAVKFIEVLREHGQLTVGVNDISRGQVGGKELSGTAMALLDSKALQLSSNLQKNYYQLLEDFGTGVLNTLKLYAQTERIVSVVGEQNRASMHRTFSREDIKGIDRVVVESSNPLSKTTAGRIELGERLMAGVYPDGRPWIQRPEEYIALLQTGNLQPMLEGETKALLYVREENEALMKGTQIEVLASDNHDLHMREHEALLNDVEVRQDAAKYQIIFAHLMTHISMAQDPANIQLQVALGRRAPLPPMLPAPPGARKAQGTPPAEAGGPGLPAPPQVQTPAA